MRARAACEDQDALPDFDLQPRPPFEHIYELGLTAELEAGATGYRIESKRDTHSGIWYAECFERAMEPLGPWIPLANMPEAYGDTADAAVRSAYRFLGDRVRANRGRVGAERKSRAANGAALEQSRY